MSINDNSSNAQRSTAPKTATRRGSLLGLGSLLGAPINRNANGAALAGFTKAISDIIGEADKSLKAEVFALDNQATGLVYSIIAIKGEVNGAAAVYQLIVASSAETRGSRIVKNGNREWEIPRVPGDIYTAQLWDKVSEQLQPRLPGKQLHDVGACVLPVTLDHENIEAVRRAVHAALCSIVDWIAGHQGQDVYFCAADYKESQFRSKLVFNGGATEDALGNPLRTNFSLTLTGAENNGSNNEDIMQNETVVANTRGFVNLRYVGPQPMPTPMGVQYTPQMFVPVINIVTTSIEQDILTPELHLVALALSVVLGRNDAWKHSFRPVRGDEWAATLTRLDGLSSDTGVLIDTKDPNAFDLAQFMQQFVFGTPVWRIDVEECGEQTWLNEVLRDAARGVPEAYNLIIATANRLSNNIFGTLFPAGQPIGTMEDDRIILGWYNDRNSQRRDLREIDKLAIDNMNPTDPTVGLQYERTLNPDYAPMEQRLSERVAILRDQLQNQLQITGYATGVMLNPEFLMALFVSIERAGMLIRMDNAYDAERTYDRAMPSLLGYGMNTGALQQQQAGYNSNYAYNPYGTHYRSR